MFEMNETAWNEFLKRIKEEYKSLKEELEDYSDDPDMKEVIQQDLQSVKDEYEIMSQQYSKEYGIGIIPSFEELTGKERDSF